ncbi:MAG: S-methyl-5-thioribose-1-phosphate isomerase [Candidatus Geothermarchaeota archaeon]
MNNGLRSVYWINGKIIVIDQSKLPFQINYLVLRKLDEIINAIATMKVRGAPLLGVIGALGLAQIAYYSEGCSADSVIERLKDGASALIRTRPTAANLCNAVERILKAAMNSPNPRRDAIDEALRIVDEEVSASVRIAEIGQTLIDSNDVILTHCNTGSLATVTLGTALGIIIHAHRLGKRITVYFTETRPILQGARLTAVELIKEGIKCYLIPDSAAAYVIKVKGVNKVIVGADRILNDGTVFNKIGTLQIAIAAREHHVEFYVAAPLSSLDFRSRVSEVVVEERDKNELIFIKNQRIAPVGIDVFNPSFDVTPSHYIDGIVTDRGIAFKPFTETLKLLYRRYVEMAKVSVRS